MRLAAPRSTSDGGRGRRPQATMRSRRKEATSPQDRRSTRTASALRPILRRQARRQRRKPQDRRLHHERGHRGTRRLKTRTVQTRNPGDHLVLLRMVSDLLVIKGRRLPYTKKPRDRRPNPRPSLLLPLLRHESSAPASKAGSTAPQIPSLSHHSLQSRCPSNSEAQRNIWMIYRMSLPRLRKVTGVAATRDGQSPVSIQLILSTPRVEGRADVRHVQPLPRPICLAHQRPP